MNGPQHYQEAERLVAPGEHDEKPGEAGLYLRDIARAQVHATLALAAATALPHAGELPVADHDAWWAAAGDAPVWRDPGEVTR